jgi:glutathione S-transferase
MAIRFYSWPKSSGSRVSWALEELGVPYEYIELDRAKNEHKAPEFLAINPNGKVPALIDDGVSYFESLAIILHLGERYGVDRGLWPKAGQERADAMSWSVWSLTELYVYMRDHVYHGVDSPISYKPEQRSAAAAAFDLSVTKKNLAMLEERLAGRDYICGAFNLADACVGSVVRFGTMLGVSLSETPNVQAYLARLNARPAVARIR